MKKNTSKSSPARKAIIGYKRVLAVSRGEHPVDAHGRAIVKLRIPANAAVVSCRNEGGKHRASRAKVVGAVMVDGSKPSPGMRFVAGYGRNDPRPFLYRVGAMVTPRKKFGTDKTKQCASGIHFFKRRSLALDYAI